MASANEQPSKSPLQEGQVIDGHRIVRKLGEGGMGVVYEGVHEQTGERVAIKLLHSEIAKHREVTLRFVNEARAVEIIRHPGLVRTVSTGQLEGVPYLIMEFLDGTSLSAYLREHGGRLSLIDTLDVVRQVADALAASHDKGIVHRDRRQDPKVCLHKAPNLSPRRRTDHDDAEPRPLRSLLLPPRSRESGQSHEQSLRLRSSLDGQTG